MKKPLILCAKELRNNSTETEKYLWYVLRNKGLGVKFRRQSVIGHDLLRNRDGVLQKIMECLKSSPLP
ncbi:MAG: DUF559 domain-containing protein, partial [Candidatus Omnitrophica bacterium]|nr:DUF559 domain-containing protein [Candidatus Omnitrophota bacterium]